MVDLEISWIEDDTLRRIDGKCHAFWDIVIDPNEFYRKASRFDEIYIRIDDLVFDRIRFFRVVERLLDDTQG